MRRPVQIVPFGTQRKQNQNQLGIAQNSPPHLDIGDGILSDIPPKTLQFGDEDLHGELPVKAKAFQFSTERVFAQSSCSALSARHSDNLFAFYLKFPLAVACPIGYTPETANMDYKEFRDTAAMAVRLPHPTTIALNIPNVGTQCPMEKIQHASLIESHPLAKNWENSTKNKYGHLAPRQ